MSNRPPRVRVDRCVCLQREFAELLLLARLHEWRLEDLARETGCSTRCGLCRPYLRRMLSTGVTMFQEILVEPRAEE